MQDLIISIEALINKIEKVDFVGLYVEEVFKIEQELVKINIKKCFSSRKIFESK